MLKNRKYLQYMIAVFDTLRGFFLCTQFSTLLLEFLQGNNHGADKTRVGSHRNKVSRSPRNFLVSVTCEVPSRTRSVRRRLWCCCRVKLSPLVRQLSLTRIMRGTWFEHAYPLRNKLFPRGSSHAWSLRIWPGSATPAIGLSAFPASINLAILRKLYKSICIPSLRGLEGWKNHFLLSLQYLL